MCSRIEGSATLTIVVSTTSRNAARQTSARISLPWRVERKELSVAVEPIGKPPAFGGLAVRPKDVRARSQMGISARGGSYGVVRGCGEPLAEVAALDVGRGEVERQRVRAARLCGASQAAQEIGARGREQVVAGKISTALDLVDEFQPCLRAVGHRD